MNLDKFFVLNTDNTINVDQSVAAYRQFAEKTKSERETDLDLIAEGVHALFDQHKGTRISLDAIKSMVLNALPIKLSVDAYTTLSARVESYIRGNLQTEGKPGLFVSHRGRNAGVQRVSDMPIGE